MLKITHTEQFNAIIEIDGKQVKAMSQSFDENGKRSGAIGEYVTDKEVYYANILDCRKDEDSFLQQMRDIEDSNSIAEVPSEIKE